MQEDPKLILCSPLKSSIVAVLILACLGCAAIMGNRRGDLTFAVSDYNQGIRWGILSNALVYVPEDKKRSFIEDMNRLYREVSIADFQLQALMPDDKVQSATALVRVGFYGKQSLRLQTINQVQHWAQVNGHWYIMDPDLKVFLRELKRSP